MVYIIGKPLSIGKPLPIGKPLVQGIFLNRKPNGIP